MLSEASQTLVGALAEAKILRCAPLRRISGGARYPRRSSIEAEKLAMFRAYNPERAVNLAMKLAGLDRKK
jgi:hypothetical protein